MVPIYWRPASSLELDPPLHRARPGAFHDPGFSAVAVLCFAGTGPVRAAFRQRLAGHLPRAFLVQVALLLTMPVFNVWAVESNVTLPESLSQ